MTAKPRFFRPSTTHPNNPAVINIELIGFVRLRDWLDCGGELEILLTNKKPASVFYASLHEAEDDLKVLTRLIRDYDNS